MEQKMASQPMVLKQFLTKVAAKVTSSRGTDIRAEEAPHVCLSK